ANRYGFGL
nr:callatostatin 3=neuropeptide [Calliphora vomitoria=blowflies, thoracic ganglia, Peptide, 8 aa] [Calliphora vomitoria]